MFVFFFSCKGGVLLVLLVLLALLVLLVFIWWLGLFVFSLSSVAMMRRREGRGVKIWWW